MIALVLGITTLCDLQETGYSRFFERPKMITDKNEILQNTHPHYTDERFRKEQTIFGQEEDDLNYEYSDRLAIWDSETKKDSVSKADKVAKKLTAAWYEAYLSAHYEKPVDLRHIIAGVNRSNGYSYLIFGFKLKGD